MLLCVCPNPNSPSQNCAIALLPWPPVWSTPFGLFFASCAPHRSRPSSTPPTSCTWLVNFSSARLLVLLIELLFVSVRFALHSELIFSHEIDEFSTSVLLFLAPKLPWILHPQLPTVATLSTSHAQFSQLRKKNSHRNMSFGCLRSNRLCGLNIEPISVFLSCRSQNSLSKFWGAMPETQLSRGSRLQPD